MFPTLLSIVGGSGGVKEKLDENVYACSRPGGRTREMRLTAFLGTGFARGHERGGGILERKLRNTGAEHGLKSVLRFFKQLVRLAVALLGIF